MQKEVCRRVVVCGDSGEVLERNRLAAEPRGDLGMQVLEPTSHMTLAKLGMQ
jgi:hypothetical protein